MPNDKFPPLPPNAEGLGVSWFREEDWPRWMAMDPLFQPDYQHWLKRSEEALREYAAKGITLEKVMLDPDEFLTWARATGEGTSQAARGRYVAIKTMRKRTTN